MTLVEEHALLDKLRVAMSLIETLKQEKDLVRENFDSVNIAVPFFASVIVVHTLSKS